MRASWKGSHLLKLKTMKYIEPIITTILFALALFWFYLAYIRIFI